MEYIKTIIEISPAEEWIRDVISAQLADAGYDSFVETENGLEAYIPAKLRCDDDVKSVLENYAGSFAFNVEHETIKDQNWNEVWEKNYFKPLVVADKCVVRAPFHTDYPKAEFEIIIEPNMAFGTGNHETTSMMLEAILDHDFENKTVLDMGCGTGILGILASMKGAKKITAIDIDEWSFSGTKENAALNSIQNIEVKLGDASLLGNEKYDFIFANIHKNVLIEDMASYAKNLNPAGKIFLSGFYETDLNEIMETAQKNGLRYVKHHKKNNWVVAVMEKTQNSSTKI
ncbi:MAG: 50S ribosomal protein L11 methyltransferase [Prolixibacteraceae bacterium]|nr:50S ribosomal protein L11 methyltransferase [Prolixibacteraceae bacterium]